MRRKKTHEEYVDEVKHINPDIDVVGQYINARTSISHYCKKHNVLWDAAPTNILKGHGCAKCGEQKIGEKNRMTHEEYVDRVKQIDYNIEVIGIYKDSFTPILHRCKIDGHQWNAMPCNILSGKGCPICACNITLSNEEYVNRVKLINPYIKPIGKYINAKTKITHMCLIDGYIWDTIPYVVLAGCGCPKCAGNMKKTHDKYVEELSVVNPDIDVIEPYINAKTPILHKCKIDGFEWKTSPSNALFGNGCPQCQESNGERQVRQWLELNNISYTYQKTFDNCRDIRMLPFDFYVQKYNLCIEYDGIQHFEPIDFAGIGEDWAKNKFDYLKQHDDIKNQYCKDNNIYLLRIPYYKDVKTELNNFFIHLI